MKPNFSTSENIQKFVCDTCYFKCSKKGDWNRHILTDKHKSLKNPKFFTSENIKKKYTCICGKNYKHQSTLCAHKKICNSKEMNEDSINMQDKDALILHLLKQNGDLQKSLIEMSKEKSITNNNTNNSHNKTFNLQFFLNETCKDALNITDFVSSLHPQIKDLEETGRLGFAQGISRIFINGLNDLDVHQRPLHCSDFKREIIYIKDDDQWCKEGETKDKLTTAIKKVAHKNMQQIQEWQKANPHYNDPDSKENDKYMKIVYESMSGSSKEESEKNYNKIIKNIVKETTIDK
jgi:hypothetical protein